MSEPGWGAESYIFGAWLKTKSPYFRPSDGKELKPAGITKSKFPNGDVIDSSRDGKGIDIFKTMKQKEERYEPKLYYDKIPNVESLSETGTYIFYKS